jgi:O-methyltransferase domain/Dimerisation domain
MAQHVETERAGVNAPQVKPLAPMLLQMLLGNRVQQTIYVAAKLGIADLLKDGPKEIADLAQATGAHPGALYRLLRTLAGYGIFAESESDRFTLTPLASLLQTGIPGSLHAVALWFGSVAYQVFSGLEYSVRTGEPAFDHIFGMEFFQYLEHHLDVGALFDEVMTRQTAEVTSTLLAAYDFSEIGTLVDVGGGRGELIIAVLKAYPGMRGVLFDRPHVIQGANGLLESAGVADRCTTACGDISESVPCGGDAYLLKSIIHGASDELAVQWLRNCCHAMDGRGKLLLVEYIIPPGNDLHPGKLMDVLMLVGTHGGRERTEAEFRSLLAEAGFHLARIVPTPSFYSVIEGVPA